MPISRNYKAGAIIFFEGDQKSDEIYVMKSGLVTLTYRDMDSLSHVSEKLKVGDFFGVKSALSRHTKQETARAVENSVLLVLNNKEFENLVLKKINVVLKMLKIYSNQLRKIEKKASELLSSSGFEKPDPEKSLFEMAQYYSNVQKWSEAIYVGQKYIKNYPNGEHRSSAEELIVQSKQKESAVQQEKILEKETPLQEETIAESAESEEDIPEESPVSEKLDDSPSLSEDLGTELSNMENKDTDRVSYEEIQTQMDEGHYESVLKAIHSLNDWNDLNEEKKENLHFFQGHSYFELENYEKALESLTDFAKRYPQTSQMRESLLYMGISHKKLGNDALSKSFLEKVLKLKDGDSFSETARKYLNTE